MPARLLLIEDDASIARFVELALEELPALIAEAPAVQLQVARSLAEGRAALAQGGWQLVVSDLMLPDGSAETLLAEGVARADGAPPWLVFSAGVADARAQQLAALGVARTLRKPVPLAQLLAAMVELLQPSLPGAPEAVAGAVAGDPVQDHFGGDRVLYEQFRVGCASRFADDLAQGDAALAAADVSTLRRVAHGLKAVLTLLGQPALAARAQALEEAATGGDIDGWPAMAAALRHWMAGPA
ncbi:Hpt domain-containing protein [Roseateles sp. DC23W]|uniref:Hpt domain-containing protein n=1 Tax=Pelomonas dachongensis TaxID=3299029 RepID=A0ABW7EHA2_9BURK